MTPTKMRINRLRQILTKREASIDDAKFMMDFLDNLSKDYKEHFVKYTPEMMAEVITPQLIIPSYLNT